MEAKRKDKVAVVVGDGQMAAQCAKLIAEHDGLMLPVIIHHANEGDRYSQLKKVSQRLSVPLAAVENVNDKEAVELLRKLAPDIVFSINNWDIIRQDLLAIPGDGVINFHNGPLPAYRGVNVPSWAIINGEKHHGVTWHYVATGVDTGDIVASGTFVLRPDETAISLTFRCIETGIRMFPALLDHYVSGTLPRSPQAGEAHYYSAKATPNGGYLDFTLGFDRLSALVRGLTFRPFENPFIWPRIRTDRGTLLVSAISRDSARTGGTWICGTVRQVDDEGILVCAEDSLVRVSGLMEEDFSIPTASSLERRHRLVEGKALPSAAA